MKGVSELKFDGGSMVVWCLFLGTLTWASL